MDSLKKLLLVGGRGMEVGGWGRLWGNQQALYNNCLNERSFFWKKHKKNRVNITVHIFALCVCSSSWSPCLLSTSPKPSAEPTWRAPSLRSSGASTSPAHLLESLMAVLRWVGAPFGATKVAPMSEGNKFPQYYETALAPIRGYIHSLSFEAQIHWDFLTPHFSRQPAGDCFCQLLRRQAPSSTAHCDWLPVHDCGDLSNSAAALPPGAVSWLAPIMFAHVSCSTYTHHTSVKTGFDRFLYQDKTSINLWPSSITETSFSA